MSRTFLDKILAAKNKTVERQKLETSLGQLRDRAAFVRQNSEHHRLKAALSRSDRPNIIAEIKRASPSKGVIDDNIDVVQAAQDYEKGGACAISVLTEEDYFHGSLLDLVTAKNAVDLPILRKDFIVDEFQILETAAAGADAFLLIVAALPKERLKSYLDLGRSEFGLGVIVEAHTAAELDVAAEVGADIIGVNNRNLSTFEVSLDVSRELIKMRPKGAFMISESGLSERSEIDELRSLGFDGFLIGETLMRTANAAEQLGDWL